MADYRLYLVTDSSNRSIAELCCIVEKAIQGGVTMVQLREKTMDTKTFYETALAVKEITSRAKVPLIINDRLDIALAVHADGLHIGQQDMPYNIARALLGKDKIIGLSVENIAQAKEANDLDVDYIGLSPVFSTATKADIATPLGIEGIQEIASFSKHPMVGIGGIKKHNIKEVMQAGCNGIAVVSAIMDSKDPCLAAEELILNIIEN